MRFGCACSDLGRRIESTPSVGDARRRALVLILVVHCAALRGTEWLEPGSWPGGLPPITLLAAAAGVASLATGVVIGIRGRRRGLVPLERSRGSSDPTR